MREIVFVDVQLLYELRISEMVIAKFAELLYLTMGKHSIVKQLEMKLECIS